MEEGRLREILMGRYKENDELVGVHTSIPEKLREFINQKGWRYNELMVLGVLSKLGNPQLLERIKDLEQKVAMLMNKEKLKSEKLI